MTNNVDNDITVELDGHVATVEIHRPPNNFFDYELISAIADAYEMLDADEPFLLDVIVPYAEHVLPMIAQGKSAKEILTE